MVCAYYQKQGAKAKSTGHSNTTTYERNTKHTSPSDHSQANKKVHRSKAPPGSANGAQTVAHRTIAN